jgi:GNAT superfamily N-acetyltransferase
MRDASRLYYRRARGTGDARLIARIQNRCAEEITARLGVGHWSKVSTVESVKRRMESKSLFLVYDRDAVEAAGGEERAEPVATFTVGVKAPAFWPRKAWREPGAKMVGVFGISVLPEFQRRGVGAWMMARVEELARADRAGYVRLDAYEQNPRSVAFYRKLGYEERARVAPMDISLICFEKAVPPPREDPSAAPPAADSTR